MFAPFRSTLISVVALTILFCQPVRQTALAQEHSPDDTVTSATCNCCCATKPQYNAGVGIHLADYDDNYYQEDFTGTVVVGTQHGHQRIPPLGRSNL